MKRNVSVIAVGAFIGFLVLRLHLHVSSTSTQTDTTVRALPIIDFDASPHSGGRINDDGTIFVSIASYRDVQCQPTIRDMYEKAKRPTALFVGAVEQHQSGDVYCMPPEYLTDECQLRQFCPSDNIRVRHIHPSRARGPTYGRYVGALMYSGQKYYMMIDSHNRFVTHWDHIVINMYRRLQGDGVKKPVISHYPEGWINPEVNPEGAKHQQLDNKSTTTYTCTAKFLSEHGYLRLDGATMPRPKDGKPRPQPWAAAGFLFADALVVKESPFDPYLYYVFDGEEIMYSVRMWTHGWDIFSPSENILYHDYGRKNAPKFWQYVVPSKKRSGHKRIQRFLQSVHKDTDERIVPDDYPDEIVQAETEKFGLGKVRSLKEYWKYAGADPKKYTVAKKFCQMKAR